MGEETWECETEEELSYCRGSVAQWGRRETTQTEPEAREVSEEVTVRRRRHC